QSHHLPPSKTCTVIDISTETLTSTINCNTETPTLIACPDNQQVPEDCDKCQKTKTVTCTPTMTVCAPNSEDNCCQDNGAGRNDLTTNRIYEGSGDSEFYNVTDAVECCKLCYKDPFCFGFYFNAYYDNFCQFLGNSENPSCNLFPEPSTPERGIYYGMFW
ncbi:36473_t:CDS:2, partial [Racocetra persica]